MSGVLSIHGVFVYYKSKLHRQLFSARSLMAISWASLYLLLSIFSNMRLDLRQLDLRHQLDLRYHFIGQSLNQTMPLETEVQESFM